MMRGAGIVGIAAAALVMALPGCSVEAAVNLPLESLQYKIYMQSDGTTPYLSFSADTDGPASFTVLAPGGNALGVAGSLAGDYQDARTIELELRPALNRTLYLNLSQEIHVLYRFKAELAEYPSMLVELWQAQTRIGASQAPFNPASTTNPRYSLEWQSGARTLTRESDRLVANTPLRLRFTLYDSVGPMEIETGSLSFIRFHAYEQDPFRLPLYLEDQLLRSALADAPPEASGEGRQDEKNEASPPALGAILLAVPLLAGAASRRRAALILAVVLLSGISGCVSSGPGGPGVEGEDSGSSPTARVERTESFNRSLQENRRASVYGTVRDGDKVNIPLQGARVYMEATSVEEITGKSGTFALENLVAPYDYVLIVEAKGFGTVRDPISLEAGTIAYRNVTLFRLSEGCSGCSAHLHGEWPESGSKTVFDDDVTLARSVILASVSGPTNPMAAIVRLDKDVLVLPGANRVEVVVTAVGTSSPPMASVLLHTALGQTRDYPVRPLGEKFVYTFFPIEADRGHQRVSHWTFTVLAKPATYPYKPLIYHVESQTYSTNVHVKLTIFRGVVPYEPPHLDEWGNASQLLVLKTKATGLTGNAVSQQITLATTGSTNWGPGRIPPGTKEVQGTFYWKNQPDVADADNPSWAVYYRTPIDLEWRLAPVSRWDNATGAQLLIPVSDDEADPFYMPAKWSFGYGIDPDYRAEKHDVVVSRGNVIGYLNLTAVKDPAYRMN